MRPPVADPSSAVALTLRAIGGLTTRQVAEAYLVPQETTAQRISRAKRTVSEVSLDERAALATVLRVLYLVFNAGYSGDVDLSEEAIRVARRLHVVTDHPEVAGLLASMLLHHARRAAPTRPDGALARDRLGEYRAQAAIAALHCDPAARQRPAGCRSSSGTTN